MIEKKHTIQITADNEAVLLINGKESICPFQNPVTIPQQNQFGNGLQMSIIRFPCSTGCPFADYIETENMKVYFVRCVNQSIDIDIDTDTKNELFY